MIVSYDAWVLVSLCCPITQSNVDGKSRNADEKQKDAKKSRRSLYKKKMIVPLIAPTTIATTPLVTNKVLCAVLQSFGHPQSFPNNLLQNAQTEAMKLIFGVPFENIGFIAILKEELEKAGHFMSLTFATRKEMIKSVEKIIITDEVRQRKEDNWQLGRTATYRAAGVCPRLENSLRGHFA